MIRTIERTLPRWCRTGAIFLALPLLLVFGSTPSLRADDEAEQKVTLFTAVAEPGDTENIPDKLKPYRDQLLVVSKRFRLAETKLTSVKKGTTTKIQLPEKLGEVQITTTGKTMTVEIIREKKTIGTFTVNRFPMILRDPKLKVGGQQVVLILDKGHK